MIRGPCRSEKRALVKNENRVMSTRQPHENTEGSTTHSVQEEQPISLGCGVGQDHDQFLQLAKAG